MAREAVRETVLVDGMPIAETAHAVPGTAQAIASAAQALGDPIRVQMLFMMAGGRSCCSDLPLNVPADDGEEGICVCEFTGVLGLGQSRVSYHLRQLKDAGLVREERRGKWSFYAIRREAFQRLAEVLSTAFVGSANAGGTRIAGGNGEPRVNASAPDNPALHGDATPAGGAASCCNTTSGNTCSSGERSDTAC